MKYIIWYSPNGGAVDKSGYLQAVKKVALEFDSREDAINHLKRRFGEGWDDEGEFMIEEVGNQYHVRADGPNVKIEIWGAEQSKREPCAAFIIVKSWEALNLLREHLDAKTIRAAEVMFEELDAMPF